MTSGGKVLGLALERESHGSECAQLSYYVYVREGSPDNPLFHTSPYLIKILEGEAGKKLEGKMIGHISYKEKTPGQRVFSPTILPFEKIYAQKDFYPHFKDKGIGTELNILCLADLVRTFGNVKLHMYSVSDDMSRMFSKGGLMIGKGGNRHITAEELLGVLYKTRRKNREKHILIHMPQKPHGRPEVKMGRRRRT